MNDDNFEACLIPGLPTDLIRGCYARGKGNEIESGKFASAESSAALVANAFGYFLERPAELPPLPGCEGRGWPAVDVTLERELRFPWRGGLHPWLDVVVTTATALIGIESKRYEPYRTKRERGADAKPVFSEAYSRPVWGERMGRFAAMRDLIAAGQDGFVHLDAAQLVKHAFGLRTAAHRGTSGGPRAPALVYLYAAPSAWPGGAAISPGLHARHREEAARFSAMVAGDEVAFRSISYAELVDGWRTDGNSKVQAHAAALRDRFDV